MTNSTSPNPNYSSLSGVPLIRPKKNAQSSLSSLRKLSTSDLLQRKASIKEIHESIASGTLKLPDNGTKILQTMKNIEEILISRQSESNNIEAMFENLSLASEKNSASKPIKTSQLFHTKELKKNCRIQVLDLSHISHDKEIQLEYETDKEIKETIDLLIKGTLAFQQKEWIPFSRSMNWILNTYVEKNEPFSDSDDSECDFIDDCM